MPKNLVNNELLERRIAARIGLRDPNREGVGSWKPGSALLVGEQSAHPTDSPNQQPFCDLHGCSGWLNSQLELASIPEDRLYWVNALNNDGSAVHLCKLIYDLKPSIVITMGKVADDLWNRTCDDMFPHTSVPHPQYWKRFRNKDPYPLIDVLKNTLSSHINRTAW